MSDPLVESTRIEQDKYGDFICQVFHENMTRSGTVLKGKNNVDGAPFPDVAVLGPATHQEFIQRCEEFRRGAYHDPGPNGYFVRCKVE